MCHSEMRDECKAILKDMRQDIRQIHLAMLGNGDPQKSLVSRVERNSTYLKVLGAAIILIPVVAGTVAAIVQICR